MTEAVIHTRPAQVVHVLEGRTGDDRVIINRGSADGVKVGDSYLIFGYGPRIDDPVTGEDLGRIEIVRGRGRVTHVQEHLATVTSTEWRPRKRRSLVPAGSAFAIVELLADQAGVDGEDLPFLAPQPGDQARPV